jgi:site-specific recombinase XerC
LEQRVEHWAIVDLKGKGGHVRTVPVPGWVMEELRVWLNASVHSQDSSGKARTGLGAADRPMQRMYRPHPIMCSTAWDSSKPSSIKRVHPFPC